MTSFDIGFIKRAMSFGSTYKQANDLLTTSATNHRFSPTEPALHMDGQWKRPASSQDPQKNYIMNPVQITGTLAENSLNPNALSTPNRTIHVPTMIKPEYHYPVENKFEISAPTNPHIAVK